MERTRDTNTSRYIVGNTGRDLRCDVLLEALPSFFPVGYNCVARVWAGGVWGNDEGLACVGVPRLKPIREVTVMNDVGIRHESGGLYWNQSIKSTCTDSIENGSTQGKKSQIKISPLSDGEEKRSRREMISCRRSPIGINQICFGEEERSKTKLIGLFICFSVFRFQCVWWLIRLVSDVLVIKSNIVVLTLLSENNREAFGQAWIRSISEGLDRAYFGPGLNKSFTLTV